MLNFPPLVMQPSRGALDASGGGGGAATTWNGSDIVNGALSGGNLTFAVTPTNGNGGVRSVKSLVSNQLAYFETVYNVSGSGGDMNVGVANASADLSLLAAGGTISPTFSATYGWMSDQYTCDDSANTGSFVFSVASVVGDRVDIAFNSATGKIWFRLNGSAWNSFLSTQDPAAGTGGLSVPFSGPYFAVVSGVALNDKVTATFASSSWVGTAPSGYSQISA